MDPEENEAGTAPDESFSEDDVDFDALVDMIHHDPLADNASQEADTFEGGYSEEDDYSEEQPEPLAQAPEAQEHQQAATQQPLDTSAISAAIAEGFRAAQSVPQSQQGQQGAGQQQRPQQPAGPDFGRIQIPPQVIQAMENEDPAMRAQGYQAFAGGVGNLIYSQMQHSMQQQIQQLTQTMPQIVQEHFASTERRQHVEHDFYSNYPQLNTPHLRPLVMRTAAELLRETGANGWTPEIRDALGQRVLQMFQQALPQQQYQEPEPPAQQSAPARLSSQRVGTRPSPRPDSSAPGSLFEGLSPVN